MENATYKLGLTLSGGSVKGAAHLGVIDRIHEIGLKPEIISGSSAGALMGACYASGLGEEETLDFFTKTPMFQYNTVSPLSAGIFSTEKYIPLFEKIFPATFEELEIPLIVCATNIETGMPRYFSSGDLIKPILASCAIPLIFSPLEIDGELYIDGGIVDNYPVEVLDGKCEHIIGSYLGFPGIVDKKAVNSKLKVANRANLLLMYSQVWRQFKYADVNLEIPLQKYGHFDQKKMYEIRDVGYNFAKDHLMNPFV